MPREGSTWDPLSRVIRSQPFSDFVVRVRKLEPDKPLKHPGSPLQEDCPFSIREDFKFRTRKQANAVDAVAYLPAPI